MECVLCGSRRVTHFAHVHARDYLACPTCDLVFMAPEYRLDSEAEKARYVLHENDPTDARYRAFLNRLAQPLMERLPPGARGLDYGSGPGPTLSVMFEEQGFPMEIYDPFFAPDRSVLKRRYDFITCTEAAEHFYSPAKEFARFDAMLKPGGWLGIMTETLTDPAHFADWWYVLEPSHVCFYRTSTFEWIAARFGWHLEMPRRQVALFRKVALKSSP